MKKILIILLLLLPNMVGAAGLQFSGFETGGNSEAFATSGTFSVQTTTKRTGAYALQVNPTTSATGYHKMSGVNAIGVTALYDVADVYVRFYFNITTLPAATSEEIAVATTTSDARKFSVRITSAGVLQAYDSTGTTQLGSDGATVLSTGTWYRIEVRVGTGASGNYEIKINGTSELSGTGDLTTVNNGFFYLGKHTDRNSNTVNFFYDDLWIDSSTYKGAGEIVKSSPNADGSTQSWTAGTAPSDYSTIDETPESATDYVMSPTTGNPNIGLFDFQDSSTVGVSGTINGVKLVGRLRDDATNAGSSFMRIRGGDSTNSDTSNEPFLATGIVTFSKIAETDPSTSSAWTTGGFDVIEGGAGENNAVSTRMTAAWFMVDYTPPSSSAIKTLRGLARASVKLINGLALASVKSRNGLQ